MKHVIWAIVIISFFSAAYADDAPVSTEVSEKFAEAMGLDKMLEGIMEQTRSSMMASISDLSANLRAQLPNLNEDQEKALDDIFRDYIDQIIDSVDPVQAAEIYSSTIADGLPEEEIEAATDYYSSPEGQRLLLVVNEAAAGLNEYVLNQIMAATKDAQGVMFERVGEFSASVRANAE